MKQDSVLKKLLNIQKSLSVPKNQFNDFGKYSYRSCEDITEAAKPLCVEQNALLTLSDSINDCCGRAYVEATATIQCVETGEVISVTASAREAVTKKGMDDSQITGSTSSYARKYALNGLFAIDDTKDADTMKPVVDEVKKEFLGANVVSSGSVDEHVGLLKTFTTKSEFQDWKAGTGDKLSPEIKGPIMTEYFKLSKEAK